MTRKIMFKVVSVMLAGAAMACNLSGAESSSRATETPAPPEQIATATPAIEPTEAVILAEDVCQFPGDEQTVFMSEAGGYCFLLPDSFTTSQDLGLDIFAAGPTLATFGQDRLALIVEFNVLGAPGGAGARDAQSWGARIVEENSTDEFQLTSDPFEFGQINLEGVRVGPLPGLVGSEAVFVRANDTLYGITVYPDRESFPEYLDQVEALWSEIEASLRFFTPVIAGVEYRTEKQVCPAEEADKQLVISLSEGWCALIPAGWMEDEAFNFPERFVGGPNIGEFWPGQPPHANIVIGFDGPAVDITLEQRVEGRMNSNGRPDLVQRSSATVGGFPSEILNTQDGPHPDRVALIQANGYLYSVLGQPFDTVRFPEAQEELEAAWELIIHSIQFFEPYR